MKGAVNAAPFFMRIVLCRGTGRRRIIIEHLYLEFFPLLAFSCSGIEICLLKKHFIPVFFPWLLSPVFLVCCCTVNPRFCTVMRNIAQLLDLTRKIRTAC